MSESGRYSERDPREQQVPHNWETEHSFMPDTDATGEDIGLPQGRGMAWYEGRGTAWYEHMTDIQKEFWYAARDREHAEDLRRTFASRVWYRWGLGIVVILGWVDVIFAPNPGAEIWINIVTMIPLTLLMGLGIWYEFGTIRDKSDAAEAGGSDDEPGSSIDNPTRFE